jgi:hypothetical protein
MTPVGQNPYHFTEAHHLGRTDIDDPVFAASLAEV